MGPPIETPKGTRDWAGDDLALRNDVFDKIRKVFRLHDGAEIDTPLSHRQVWTKLIYDLDEQGGTPCALRYDLTVPFARLLAMSNVRTIKRFQIGKVYRRDQPSLEKGRMREFYQCDFDYAGQCDSMVPDAEVLCIAVEVLFGALQLDMKIKINHRLILDGLFSAVGVPATLLRPISSAVDKLDKLPWPEVEKEMVEKGLDVNVATKLGEYLQQAKETDTASALSALTSDPILSANPDIQKGVGEMELLMQYLKAYGIAEHVKFDLSLARGLDYYTGLIYEVIVPDLELPEKDMVVSVGSVAAGGRYDNLVSQFSKRSIPCVGISFGIDRILTVLKHLDAPEVEKLDTWIVIARFHCGAYGIAERMALARDMRLKQQISVGFDPKADKSPRKQIDAAAKRAKTLLYMERDNTVAGNMRFKLLTLPDKNLDNAELLGRSEVNDEIMRRRKELRDKEWKEEAGEYDIE
ncbi:hypothetical protein GMOD_00008596 [Pyrenophora seminiperda CCB06]|uniref:histidine--tRNA ligase n=1 Tax=Pyrenophora seminiperda CCB06 TaxID=1302712 RepID=A0A3M7M8W7_9PLEO|nr:hypothetical protein GMOD_00008596 [Pyrenophora seminiperda CCB06]